MTICNRITEPFSISKPPDNGLAFTIISTTYEEGKNSESLLGIKLWKMA